MKYLKTYNESIKHLLKPKNEDDILDLIKDLSPTEKLLKGCQNGIFWLVKKSLEEGSNLSDVNYMCLYTLIIRNHNDIFKYLLENNYFNPTFNNNDLLETAFSYNNETIVKLLLKDKRVLDKLSTEDLKDFKEYLTESIKHLLKPKSEEHILKSLDGESLEEKFRILTLYHLYDLAKEFADKIKDYFYIYQTFLDGLVHNRTVVRFSDEEVDLIKKTD
ncbi:MAG: ankyrin repeat domain-containing protein [Saccharofermentanales bacterium]